MKPGIVAAGRIVVGLTLLISGVSKVLEPSAFLSAIHDYPAAAHLPANALAAWLPWTEIFLGACLAVGIGGRGAALWSGLLVIAYSAVLVQRAVASPQDGFWLFQTLDCGCGFGAVRVAIKLLENAVLIAFCCSAVMATDERFVVTHDD